MTILDDAPLLHVDADPEGPPETPPVEPDGEADAPPDAPVSPVLAAVAAFLASTAAGWMASGVFSGITPRLTAIGAAALGAGMFYWSARSSRPTLIQICALPTSIVVGALLVIPDATGGTANLPNLVMEALRTGGLSSPPIAFDPGWRFLVVVLVSSLSMTAASVAYATNRPRLAAVIPAPIAAAGVLIQPPGRELVSVGIALVLVIGALAVAFGADLAGQGATGQSFEVRRFARAGAALAGLLVALVAISQVGFLFPQPDESQVVPPKRPEPPPSSPDRVLFTVKADLAVPWRLGVLDVYDGEAWLTPPYDPRRFAPVEADGAVPAPVAPAPDIQEIRARFEIQDVEGRTIPGIAVPLRVEGPPDGMEVDPRTSSFRLGARARKGTGYTVVAPAPPSSKQLLDAAPPGPAMKEFLEVPKPPAAVQQLLDEIPATLPLYERLQFVRTRFYDKVVAAGAGNPVDVPPERVGVMLEGADASPYEITAGEALLARWAGIPARIGYGYFGGEAKGEVFEVRPRHGAMWIEVWFEGSGWTPIVGRPPRAKASLSDDPKQEDVTIRPTEELAALVYVPIRESSITLLYRLVQYWAVRVVPALILLASLWMLYPGVVKSARAARRRRWASAAGPRARIATSYAELRDVAIDLNIGHPTLTPLEFVDVTAEDSEHRQLAWLVSRCLWGDLTRDARDTDAERAEQWARSVRRRLLGAQTAVPRLLAFASRASLVDPFDADIPNLWWRTSYRAKARRAVKRALTSVLAAFRSRPWRRLRQARAATVVIVVVGAGLMFGGCARGLDLTPPPAGAARPADMPVVPPEVAGYRLDIEPRGDKAFADVAAVSLVSRGELYTVKGGDGVVAGTLQVAGLKEGLRERADEVRQGVIKSIANGRLRLQRLGDERVYALRLAEQRIFLAFAPDGRSFQLLVASQELAEPEQFFVSLLAAQRGEKATALIETGGAPPPDPRRGRP